MLPKKTLLSNVNLYLLLFACGILLLTATTTQAGFQWVPPHQQPEVSEPEVQVPPTPQQQPETLPLAPLPLLEEEQHALPAAPVSPPQAAQTATMSEVPEDAPATETAPVPLVRPDATPQDSGMKIKTITPAQTEPQDNDSPQTAMPAKETQPGPVMQNPEPVPPVITTKVIMPEDAPAKALATTPNSEKLLINPFPDQKTADSGPEMVAPAPMQDAPVAQPQTEPATSESNYSEAVGFGSDMPLALALSQIVPSDFAYSFGTSVNPGLLVSWNGGRPWNVVLEDMVKPHNLVIRIKNRTVHVSPKNKEEKHSAAPQNTDGPEMATVATDEPVKLSATASQPRRRIVSDPGEISQAQPSKTMAKMEQIARAANLRSIEPSSGTQDSKPGTTAKPLAVAPPPPADAPRTQLWEAGQGDSLKATLSAWSAQADTEMIWDAAHDYTINSNILVHDTFASAVKTVFSKGLEGGEAPLLRLMIGSNEGERAKLIIQDAPTPQNKETAPPAGG